MKKLSFRRGLSLLMVLVLVLGLLPVSVLAAPKTFTLDVTNDLTAFGQSDDNIGRTEKAGTDDYFTLFYTQKSRIDGSNKTFSDGYIASQRVHFGEPTVFKDGNVQSAIQIKTNSPAKVKVWWVYNGGQVTIYKEDGTAVAATAYAGSKNDLSIDELELPEAGTYYIGNATKVNFFFRIDVTEENPSTGEGQRKAWAEVAEPAIVSAADDGKGEIKVTVNAVVGPDGGDEVVVSRYDSNGNYLDERSSLLEKEEHILVFNPDASGAYSFKVELRREGEEPKAGQDGLCSFVLPFGTPIMVSGTSKGNGSVELVWSPVAEAQKYEIYADGMKLGQTSNNRFTVAGLKIGQKYKFYVVAIRNEEQKQSDTLEVTVTKDEQMTWGFTFYGPSTNEANNGYEGNLNEGGQVTVYSEGGKGKIVPNSTDGVAFYYTAVPTEYNFTLRAKVTVDSWKLSNGQEGFGLMATDRLGVSGDSAAFWNNQFMALATKVEYRYDADLEQVVKEGGTKYTMKLGLGALGKTGVTKALLPLYEKKDTETIQKYFLSQMLPLDVTTGYLGEEGGTYNLFGNATEAVDGTVEKPLTTVILEIQKNNTGYFISYYNENNELITCQKFYGADALNQLDEDYVYVGFFAARNARATFSEVQFTKILASEDLPAEEKPVEKIYPDVGISSGDVTTSKDYLLMMDPNVDGTILVEVNGQVVIENQKVNMQERVTKLVTFENYGENQIRIEFTPDPDQDLGEDRELSSTSKRIVNYTVQYNRGNYHRKTIYVSPNGRPDGAGTQEYPYDIYTAVRNVVAGQTIVLMEGTYLMDGKLEIQRSMKGTADAMIRMIADPAAATRPVLDFQGLTAGIVHGGDYWYFAGFDVTNTKSGEKGFQVSGNHNILDQLHTYRNGNSGVQISRLSGSDLTIEQWPSYNLVLNCTSYENADAGEEDADGFAAKLTCGEGNVFDGCIAYNNADDGWDLYAKVETGPIGSVTIRNCVAYNNGVRADGTISKGNGNGFKMGGESLSGKHVLENSISFNNKSKGIDSNSCPDIIVRNCISYNNGTYNVAFYTNDAADTDFEATGILSFKDSNCPFSEAVSKGENLKPAGAQDVSKFMTATNFYWNGTESVNVTGKKIGAEVFKSLSFQGYERKADGSLDLKGFLALSSKAPANTGTTGASTPSQDMDQLQPDLEHNYSQEWSYKDVNGEADPIYHWQECECGDKGNLAEHTFETIIDKEIQGDTPGSKHEECTVCHYKKPAVPIYPDNSGNEVPDGTQPSTPAPTEPQDPGEPQSLSPVVIILVVVALTAAIAAAVIVILKKKKDTE